MESEDLTQLLNQYLTEMSQIALEHGATIDKYVGDAIMIFFGDPESRGVEEDALACVTMASAMQQADVSELKRQVARRRASRRHCAAGSASIPATARSAISAAKIAWTTRSSAAR